MSDASSNGSPRVSLVLLCYRQESYIREAVAGILAQTYSPLEVILSDDCSPDSTFEIMAEQVKAYSGPHRVRINRNPTNQGIGAHLRQAVARTTGEIIVVAAGDDVSRPDRVATLVDAFTPSTYAVFSDLTEIDPQGTIVHPHVSMWSRSAPPDGQLLVRNAGGVGKGATYAYRRACFDWPWPLPDNVVCEDRVLPLRAGLLGNLAHIRAPLVAYRSHGESISASLPKIGRVARYDRQHLEELGRTIHAARTQMKIGALRSASLLSELALLRVRARVASA